MPWYHSCFAEEGFPNKDGVKYRTNCYTSSSAGLEVLDTGRTDSIFTVPYNISVTMRLVLISMGSS